MKRKFVQPRSGKKESWCIEGRNMFHKLCHIIEKLRTNDNTGKILEENLRSKFREESKQYQQRLKMK